MSPRLRCGMTDFVGEEGRSKVPSLILHVCPGGLEHGGGIGRMIGYMIDAWRETPNSPSMRVLDTRGAGHIALSPWHLARSLALIAALRRQRPLLHVHVAGRGSTIRKIIVVQFSRLLRLPIVLHLHDYNYRESLNRFPALVRHAAVAMFRASNQVVVLGQGDRNLAESVLNVDPRRLSVVPNAVPAAPDRKRSEVNRTIRILFSGNPSRRKGLHDLIAALNIAPVRDLDWMLTVAGGGSETETFREMSRKAGLSDRISFTGWVGRDQVDSLLEAADVLVLPSYAEGMAMSVLEGMSHGLCIVCTPVGSLKDVVENEVTGLIVQPGEVGALSAALARAVMDPSLRARLGGAAVRHFAENFNAASYPERMLPIYRAAFGEKR
jgi:glycosyltransferase involved in cell wall biosynthesis